MACRKLSYELQLLGRRSCNKILTGTALFRNFSASDSDDECKEPVPKPEPRPDLTMETHTHQVWAEDDYRNVRFMNAKRWVNKNIPIKWGHKRAPIKSSKRVVYCDGGGGFGGHPIVFMNLDKEIQHCFYCGQTFEKEDKKNEEEENK